MNGCASEDWFKASKGAKLLEYVENKQEEVVDLFVSLVKGEKSAEIIAKASNQTPHCDLRVNRLRTTPKNMKLEFLAKRKKGRPRLGSNQGPVG